MRKQYHFRPGDHALVAWDVDRLVVLSKEFLRITIPLNCIRELDEPFWFSGGSNAATCRAIVEHARLIDAADLSNRFCRVNGQSERRLREHAARSSPRNAGSKLAVLISSATSSQSQRFRCCSAVVASSDENM